MRIATLGLENFRGHRECVVTFQPGINVLIGRNNVGKSSVLEAIAVLAEVAGMPSETHPLPAVEVRGGFNNLVFGQNAALGINVWADVTFSSPENVGNLTPPDGPTGRLDQLRVGISLAANSNERRVAVFRTPSGDEKEVELNWGGLITTGAGNFALEIDQLALRQIWDKVRILEASRTAERESTAQGVDRLSPSAANLVQLLNALAASNFALYNQVQSSLQRVLPELQAVRAPLRAGTSTAYGATTEIGFPDVEFLWPSLAAGTKQLISLVTFIHTAPRGSVLLIEEPEVHLHPDAVMNFLELCEGVAAQEEKQFIFTTHSSLLVELVGLDRGSLVTRNEPTREGTVQSLTSFAAAERALRANGLGISHLLVSTGGRLTSPAFVLVCEGPGDRPVWSELLRRVGVDVQRVTIAEHPGGWSEALRSGLLLQLLDRFGSLCTPFLVVLDSDNAAAEKRAHAEDIGLSNENVYVLVRKEIESYLLDETALAYVSGKTVGEVAETISSTRGRQGKDKLNKVLEALGLPMDDAHIKASIASHIALDDELTALLESIVGKIAQRGSARSTDFSQGDVNRTP